MKNLRSVISAYVTLKKFTPGLQKIYTDKSTISATFSNSGWGCWLGGIWCIRVPWSFTFPAILKILKANKKRKHLRRSSRGHLALNLGSVPLPGRERGGRGGQWKHCKTFDCLSNGQHITFPLPNLTKSPEISDHRYLAGPLLKVQRC